MSCLESRLHTESLQRARTIRGSTTLTARVFAALRSALDDRRRARRIRHGLASLRELDDYALRDLGVDRGELERVARYGR